MAIGRAWGGLPAWTAKFMRQRWMASVTSTSAENLRSRERYSPPISPNGTEPIGSRWDRGSTATWWRFWCQAATYMRAAFLPLRAECQPQTSPDGMGLIGARSAWG